MRVIISREIPGAPGGDLVVLCEPRLVVTAELVVGDAPLNVVVPLEDLRDVATSPF